MSDKTKTSKTTDKPSTVISEVNRNTKSKPPQNNNISFHSDHHKDFPNNFLTE